MEKYEIINKLGQGTFGTVYLCHHLDTGRQCVMKRMLLRSLSNKERASALQEASVLKRLSHPNIVGYFDTLSTKHKLYLIMQFCDGGDLEQRLQVFPLRLNYGVPHPLPYPHRQSHYHTCTIHHRHNHQPTKSPHRDPRPAMRLRVEGSKAS